MSNNQNIISETESLQNWNYLPYVSIKSEIIMTIKQLDFFYRNRKSKVLDFYKGELVIVGTYCGIDGTDFALSLLKKLGKQKTSAAYISTGSMDYESIGQKLLSFSASVSNKKIKSAELRSDDFKKIEKSAGELFESPLLIKCSPNCSLEKLEFFIEEMIKENPLELVIIDSLDYIRELAFADKNQLEDYQSSLQDLMCGLSNLAKMNNIVLLVITEVPVLSENGIEGPSLKAFSRAMAIPNEADMVLLLYRKEDNTDEDSIDVIEDLCLTIAKNKRGELGEIPIKRINYTGGYFFCEK